MNTNNPQKSMRRFWVSGTVLSLPVMAYWVYLAGYDFTADLKWEFEFAWQVGVPCALAVLWLQWLGWVVWQVARGRMNPAALYLGSLWTAWQGVSLVLIAYRFAHGHYDADGDRVYEY
ncbi:MAG: hypothetical protein AAF288_06565 [Planctomycetota bacterium]